MKWLKWLTVSCEYVKTTLSEAEAYLPPGQGLVRIPTQPETDDLKLFFGGIGRPVILPEGYGGVVFVAYMSSVLLAYKYKRFMMARRDFYVPNPFTYCKRSNGFNCHYKAYQGMLEVYPQFLFVLMIGGLEMPYFCLVGGLLWIGGQYCSAKFGYYNLDPSGKTGWYYWMGGQLMLTIATIRYALKRLWC